MLRLNEDTNFEVVNSKFGKFARRLGIVVNGCNAPSAVVHLINLNVSSAAVAVRRTVRPYSH